MRGVLWSGVDGVQLLDLVGGAVDVQTGGDAAFLVVGFDD